MNYDKLLKASGFKVKSVAVHGPDEPDFKGWGCPYPPRARASREDDYRVAWAFFAT